MRTRIFIFIFVYGYSSATIVEAQWTEYFDDACGLSLWYDIQVEEGWNIEVMEELDISLTSPGFLRMMPYTVTWYADYRGPFLYRFAEGDFVFTGYVLVTNRSGDGIPAPQSAYSLGGLMVRNPKDLTNGGDGWMAGEEDYVFLSIGQASNGHPSCPGCPPPHFEVKSTINSSSILNISSVDTAAADIRMVRLAPYLLVLYRHPGQDWIVHRRYLRADLQDSVQVGMVTYTDWNKGSTYTMPFHNTHVINDDLDPDPSSNPGLPFMPDIVTRYDNLAMMETTMPAAWVGSDLTDENQVSDEDILELYGDVIPAPSPPTEHIWIGGEDSNWANVDNWLSGDLPSVTDTVRINTCECDAVHCVTLPAGSFTIGGLQIRAGAILTIPSGSQLTVNGPWHNEGTVIVTGQLTIQLPAGESAENFGEIECQDGGVVSISEN